MIKKPINQKHELGCGIACLAFILNKKYDKIAKEIGIRKIKSKGLYCKEIVNYLIKNGYIAFYRYLKSKWKKAIYKDNTIVFIKRCEKYPFGHYLVRYKNFWMDPWINFQKNKNIKQAKAGFRKKLPGKPIYGIFIMRESYVMVFDLDGTIVDSVELHAKSFKYAIKKLGYENYNELYKKYKKLVGIPMEEIVKKIIPNISKKEIEKIRDLKDKYFIKNIKKIKIYKKVLNILKIIKRKGVKVALFTSSSRKIVFKILKKLKLLRYFDFFVCKEDVKNPKPNKEGLIKIMKKFKTRNLIFVGDTKFDELAAKNAKIKFIYVKRLTKKKLYKILGMN